MTGNNPYSNKTGSKGTTKTLDKPPRDEETNCTVSTVLNATSNTTCDHEAAEKKIAIPLDESAGSAKRNNLKRTINNELTLICPDATDKEKGMTRRYHRECKTNKEDTTAKQPITDNG